MLFSIIISYVKYFFYIWKPVAYCCANNGCASAIMLCIRNNGCICIYENYDITSCSMYVFQFGKTGKWIGFWFISDSKYGNRFPHFLAIHMQNSPKPPLVPPAVLLSNSLYPFGNEHKQTNRIFIVLTFLNKKGLVWLCTIICCWCVVGHLS